MMRLAFLIQDVFRQGAEYATAMMANGFAGRGHQVDVVVSAWHRKLVQERQDIAPFQFRGEVSLRHLPHLKARQNVRALRTYFDEARPDVVIVMNSTYLPVALCARMIAKNSPAIILVDHSCGKEIHVPGSLNHTRRKTCGEIFRRGAERWAKHKADGIFVVSSGTKRNLIADGIPEESVSVVYNPVVDKEFFSRTSLPPSHPWLLNKETPVIVAAGAICETKGYALLIEALCRVREKCDARLIIFGEGPLKESLMRQIRANHLCDAVSLPGFTDNLPANMKASDVFVVSSFYESFSVVLVEALACGTPVVSTNCPVGPPEILAGGKFGVLVEVGNPVSLADGLLQVLNGKGIPASPESWQPYCLDAIADRYESGVQTAVRRHCQRT